jgi:hypothetical protein
VLLTLVLIVASFNNFNFKSATRQESLILLLLNVLITWIQDFDSTQPSFSTPTCLAGTCCSSPSFIIFDERGNTDGAAFA